MPQKLNEQTDPEAYFDMLETSMAESNFAKEEWINFLSCGPGPVPVLETLIHRLLPACPPSFSGSGRHLVSSRGLGHL